MGKVLITVGVLLVIAGLLVEYSGKLPWLGKLPGDLRYEGKNIKFFAPITTSIIISLILTLVFFLVNKFRQ